MRDKRDSRKKRFIAALTAQGTFTMLPKLLGSLARLLIAGYGKSLTSRINGTRRTRTRLTWLKARFYQQAIGGNTLARIFYLKAHRPIYRDRLNIDIEQLNSEIKERMAQLGVTPQLRARVIPALTE